jgi:hypothetical protein
VAKFVPVFANDVFSVAIGPAVDMLTGAAAGQLIVEQFKVGAGGANAVAVQLFQGPTNAGPWVKVPSGGLYNTTDSVPVGTNIVPYTRSARFVQLQVTTIGGVTFYVLCSCVEPPPPLSLTGP